MSNSKVYNTKSEIEEQNELVIIPDIIPESVISASWKHFLEEYKLKLLVGLPENMSTYFRSIKVIALRYNWDVINKRIRWDMIFEDKNKTYIFIRMLDRWRIYSMKSGRTIGLKTKFKKITQEDETAFENFLDSFWTCLNDTGVIIEQNDKYWKW